MVVLRVSINKTTPFFSAESMSPSMQQPYPYCLTSSCRMDRHLFLLIFIDELLCRFVISCHVPADVRQENMFWVDILIGVLGKIKLSIIYSLFTIARISQNGNENCKKNTAYGLLGTCYMKFYWVYKYQFN